LRGRVDDEAQLVELVDQLRQVVIDREHPAAIEQRIDALHRRKAVRHLVGGDGIDLVHRAGLLPDMRAAHHGAAKARALLLQQQLDVGGILVDEERRNVDRHG
jgi:hypothetical protein